MLFRSDDENYRMFSEEYGDTAMEDNEEEGGEEQRTPDEHEEEVYYDASAHPRTEATRE